MCPPVPTAPDIDWQMPNNFSMVQTGMVCNTFAKQYFRMGLLQRKLRAQKKGLSYDNPLITTNHQLNVS